ncbi:MAG: class I SAM-dependent methyltransferase [Chitinophagaceae bacterium]|nr:class I SAM-dependent methyltransferase [Chitinophagaceae bacterium]
MRKYNKIRCIFAPELNYLLLYLWSSMQEWFENWFDSPYYHLLYQHRSELEARGFVDMLYQYLHPQADATLLDLACGKGRHAKAFAAFPLDVTGLDLSAQSIASAKKLESDNLHFYIHDMRKVFRVNYFDIICNLFTSFGYFASPHDHDLAAQSIYGGLKPGGHLVIDFVNQIPARKHIDDHRHETIVRDEVCFDIRRSYTEQKLLKEIRIQDGDQQFCFSESVTSFSLTEMVKLFTQTGLKHIQTFGNYTLGGYDESLSPRMILIFQK